MEAVMAHKGKPPPLIMEKLQGDGGAGHLSRVRPMWQETIEFPKNVIKSD